MQLTNGKLPWPWIDPNKALPWVEERIGLSLAESQIAAIRLALMPKVLVITGGPGVGKTTIVNAILRILVAKEVRLLLCAPTGRAAKRMTEATGFEAKTIHRLLEVDPKSGGFKRGDDNQLDCDLLVVDETSMVDVLLMQALMKAIPDKGSPPARWRHRPASFGRTWPSTRRRHLVRWSAGCPPHRSISAGGREPHHYQRPSHQPGLNPRSQPTGSESDF